MDFSKFSSETQFSGNLGGELRPYFTLAAPRGFYTCINRKTGHVVGLELKITVHDRGQIYLHNKNSLDLIKT